MTDFTAPFFFHAKLHPRRPALMWIGGGVSCAQLAGSVEACAGALREAGVLRSDIVIIDVALAHRHAVVLLALAHLGVASASFEAGRREALEAAGATVVIADHAVEATACRVLRTRDEWFAVRGDASPLPDIGFCSEDSLFRLKASSGTTGRPQAVPITLRDEMRGIEQHRFFPVDGRTLSLFGFSTGVGTRAFLRAMLTGETFCLAGNSQEAYDTIQLCGVERLLASTQQLRDLARRAEEAGEPLQSLKSVVTGGSSISSRLIAQAQRFVCNNLLVHYASTQAGFVAIAPATALEGRPGAVGFIAPDIEVECVGDDGARLAPGEEGELRIRTRNTDERGRLAPQAEAAGFRDGWFYPGDIGRIDPDGMLVIAGRKSERINIGGVKIAPDLVDEVLLAQAGVRDAAAFGVRNALGDDELWAAVTSDAEIDPPALIAACRRALGPASPSVVLRAQAIPRNAAGKPLRLQLAREIEALTRQMQSTGG